MISNLALELYSNRAQRYGFNFDLKNFFRFLFFYFLKNTYLCKTNCRFFDLLSNKIIFSGQKES